MIVYKHHGFKPVSFARLRHISKALFIPLISMEHFPAFFITSPLSFNVIEQFRKAQTADIFASEEERSLDLAGEDTHGFDVRPN